MYRRQNGITALGFLIVAIFLGVILLAVIKLAPVYLEYAKVESSLNKVATEFQGERPSVEDIRTAIQRRFDIEDVRSINSRDISVTREPGGYTVTAAYEGRVSYLANLSLVAAFQKTVEIKR